MTMPQAEALGKELVTRIFSQDERWGWEFAPPHPVTPHPEANRPPARIPVPPPDLRGLKYRKMLLKQKIWKLIVGGLILLGGLGTLAGSAAGLFPVLIGAGLLGWYFAPIQMINNQVKSLTERYQGEVARREQEFQAVYAEWQRRLYSHDQSEQYRVSSTMEFYPLDPEAPPRVDIFGGTGAGWTSILATGGASLLAGGSGVLLLDLSELSVGAGLVMFANNATPSLPVGVRELPGSLERIGLLEGLDPREAAELLADAFDADRRGGGDASLRAIDFNILRAVASSISAPLTFARFAAALRILDNQSSAIYEGVFSEYEVSALQQRMHDLGGRERTADQISFLRTELETLAGHDPAAQPGAPVGTPAQWWPDAGTLRVLATTSAGRGGSGRRKLLTDRVLVQMLLHQLRNNGQAGSGTVVMIAGTDHLGRDTLTALTRQAEVSRVRLVLLFKNLSDDAEKLIGTGHSAAIFMRLGNSREAATAAEHIGKVFRFVLSQLTNQVGTGFTEGFANSYGEQDGTSQSFGKGGNRGWGPGGRSSGDSWNSSTTTSHSSTWTNTVNVSNAVNESVGATVQREKDYTVEPTVLQSLAATAFILVGTGSGPGRVRPGDCNPGLVLLPKVAPLPREIAAGPNPADPNSSVGGTTPTQQIPAPQSGYQQQQQPPGYPQQHPTYPNPYQQAYPPAGGTSGYPYQQPQQPYNWPGQQ
ncbi:hypothetical protein [Pseudofrankia sp. BMG5.36]|uniref:hypothetical protein n=1 Tax=Pseudofrankia sp. BMG5.36 TaxID=1834512 RepID=UPI0008DA41A9|nr:hypothetical protein [Pseudofrankia sp. BMG5.36]OHV44673.1 hypothetical protein BCD48_24580 [Pseudofrankia sp. BMG5.36]